MSFIYFVIGIIIGFLLGSICIYFVINRLKKDYSSNQLEYETKMNMLFENITNKLMKENAQELTIKNKDELNNILIPFKEKVEEMKKKFEINDEKFLKLDFYIKNVIEVGNKISQDTNNLALTLKGDNKVQGRWGEIILERVLELSGLIEGEEYLLQKGTIKGKPDAIVLLPQNKAVFIDAKTSFSSYDSFCNSDNEEEKKYYLKQFQESIKNHITNLAKKEYFNDDNYNTPEYVLMFIPIESCYSMIFNSNSQLWEYAWKNKIMPTSPSTLLAALKLINSFHMVNRQNKNACEIANLAGRMVDKFVSFLDDIESLKKVIDKLNTKLNGRDNLINQAKRLKDLGAKSSKEILVSEENI